MLPQATPLRPVCKALAHPLVVTLLFAVLGSPVSAASNVEALQDLLTASAKARPSLAIVCSPLSDLVEKLQPIVDHPLSVEAVSVGSAPLLDLLKNDGLTHAGLLSDGVLSLELWPQGVVRVGLPFEGDVYQVDDLYQVFAKGSSGVVSSDSGQVQIQFGEPESHGALPVAGLFDGLPRVPGCAIFMSRHSNRPGPLQRSQVSLVVDLKARAGVMRAWADLDLPEIVVDSTGTDPIGSSIQEPDTLLVLGVPLETLLESIWQVSPEPVASEHGRLVRKLRVAEGTTVAVFDVLGDREFAAVLPLRGRFGLPVSRRRSRNKMERMFQVQEIPCELTSGLGLACTVQEQDFFVDFGRSVVLVSSSQALGEEVLDGRGTPWREQLSLPQAEKFLVTAAVDLTLPGSGSHILAGAGVRVESGFLETHFTIDEGLGWSLLIDRLAKENHARILQRHTQRGWAEMVDVIEEIYVAEVQYEVEHEAYLGLVSAPRILESLTTMPVEWEAPQGWEALDWSPAHPLLGIYWVEVSEDGTSFTIHGACDTDGDGIAAHFSRTKGQGLERHSLAEVY